MMKQEMASEIMRSRSHTESIMTRGRGEEAAVSAEIALEDAAVFGLSMSSVIIRMNAGRSNVLTAERPWAGWPPGSVGAGGRWLRSERNQVK